MDGFRLRYGRWPTRYRAPSLIMNDLRILFTERDFLTLTSKIKLLVDDGRLVAEDDDGGMYSYCDEGFPDHHPQPNAEDWFGVRPKSD